MFFNWNNWNWNTQAILFTLHFSFLYEASERLAQFAHHPCASSWLFVFHCVRSDTGVSPYTLGALVLSSQSIVPTTPFVTFVTPCSRKYQNINGFILYFAQFTLTLHTNERL